MSWVLNIAEFITAIGIIVGMVTSSVSKLFDIKLRPLTNRDRKQIRFEIVSFASELHKGIPHTRDEYLAVFELIDEYKDICEQLDIKNHVFEEECEYIDSCFQKMDIQHMGKES